MTMPTPTPAPPATLRVWTDARLPEEVRAALERLRHLDGARALAVMPDVHLAREVCIGVALGTEGWLYPAAVGGDIGCGVAAVRFTGASARDLTPEAAGRLLALLDRLVPILKHRPEQAPDLPAKLRPAALSHRTLRRRAEREGPLQLGTIGRGNHFLELLSDDAERLWALVHTGSRSLGPAIQRHHRALAAHRSGGLEAIAADSAAGRAYLGDVGWARRYAAESRRSALTAAAAALGAVLGAEPEPHTGIDADHNHVAEEAHGGRRLWVHRKGALRAAAGSRAVIPGSMGAPSFVVEGCDCAAALGSSSHGAGRQLSRAAARRAISARALADQLGEVFVDPRKLDRLREEAPGAYKDIGAVMRAQRALVRIRGRLTPRLSHKGT